MASKTQKIAVVGNRDAILPFQMIGFQTFPVAEAQETINTLRHLSQEDFGIIYLTEDMAQEIPDTIAHYDRQVTPAVILILLIRERLDWDGSEFETMSKKQLDRIFYENK